MNKAGLLLERIVQGSDAGCSAVIERHIGYVTGVNSGTTEEELFWFWFNRPVLKVLKSFHFIWSKMLDRKNGYFSPLKDWIKASKVIDSPFKFNVNKWRKVVKQQE